MPFSIRFIKRSYTLSYLLCFYGIWPDIPAVAASITYNLNTASGLPSDYVYFATTDHLGYLWLATPKGVVRYNGYEAIIFDATTGLPKEDVWRLQEDSSGRMWLSTIADEIGYIRNGRYQTAIYGNGGFIYPHMLTPYRDGIALLDTRSNDFFHWHCFTYTVQGFRHIYTAQYGEQRLMINEHTGLFLAGENGACYEFEQGYGRKRYSGRLPEPVPRQAKAYSIGGFVCYYQAGDTAIHVLDRKRSFLLRSFRDSRETIVLAYPVDNHLYVQTQYAVYLYDHHLQEAGRYDFAAFSNGEKQQDHRPGMHVTRSALWGIVLCTPDKGAYITTEHNNILAFRGDIDMKGFRRTGPENSDRSYWWNARTRALKTMTAGRITGSLRLPHGLPAISEDYLQTCRLLAPLAPFELLHDRTGLVVIPGRQEYLSPHIKAAAAVSNDTIFLLTIGTHYSLCRYSGGKLHNLSPTHCTNMRYDIQRRGLWLYQEQQITFYDIGKNCFRTLKPAALRSMGLKRISAVLPDPVYGNLFILADDGLYLMQEKMDQVTPLLTGNRYQYAQMVLKGDTLIVAGRFGLLYTRILARNLISEATVYENARDHFYRQVEDLFICGNQVLLQTDKGLYETAPTKPAAVADTDRSRLIAITRDTARIIQQGDTMICPRGTGSISLDLINPSGHGKVIYNYRFSDTGNWHSLSGNELDISRLEAGHLNRISLHATDDVWRGTSKHFCLLVQPWWWQTRIFYILMFLAGLILCGGIVLVTRKLVLRRQRQQQLLLEMNLGAVHAQINPHFIFNTLTTTQYLIRSGKPEEASGHISRFSRLLRNFLKASRNKYTSISEEIGHLENYIAMEQERFRESFSYTISVSPGVDTSNMIPSLLLQPLVENAIRHGLMHKDGKGQLLITFEPTDTGLVIRIDDDGIGREQSKKLQHNARESYGTGLLDRLVRLFNTYEKTRLEIRYTDKQAPQTGTVVLIHIHYPDR